MRFNLFILNRATKNACFFLGLLLFIFQQNAWSQSSLIKVIREVQHFTASTGTTSLPVKLRILVQATQNDSLLPVAHQLRDDLKLMHGIRSTIKTTSDTVAGRGEILLRYSASRLKNPEAYTMSISNCITISGSGKTGTFWGTRTVARAGTEQRIHGSPEYPPERYCHGVCLYR